METTKSIFAISPSGYLDNDNLNAQQTNIVEIVKSSIDKISESKS